jgi:hypothetical protein
MATLPDCYPANPARLFSVTIQVNISQSGRDLVIARQATDGYSDYRGRKNESVTGSMTSTHAGEV